MSDLLKHTAKADGCFGFSAALIHLKDGGCVARQGWNGAGMFIFLVGGSTFTVNREPLKSILGEGTQVNYHPHIDMKTADGTIVPWLASQTDILAEDWQVVPGNQEYRPEPIAPEGHPV